jgi:hypothetical protein
MHNDLAAIWGLNLIESGWRVMGWSVAITMRKTVFNCCFQAPQHVCCVQQVHCWNVQDKSFLLI